MANTFEFWMERERYYAKLEMSWVDARDYTWAERCHKLRWRCMDLAVEALQQEAQRAQAN